MSHYTFPEVVAVSSTSREITLAQLVERARTDLDAGEVTIDFSRDIIHKLACGQCGAEEELFSPVGSVPYVRGKCPADGHMRAVISAHSYSGTEPFGYRSLDQLGLPPFDVFTARSGEREIAYLLAGDQNAVLGQLALGAAH